MLKKHSLLLSVLKIVVYVFFFQNSLKREQQKNKRIFQKNCIYLKYKAFLTLNIPFKSLGSVRIFILYLREINKINQYIYSSRMS